MTLRCHTRPPSCVLHFFFKPRGNPMTIRRFALAATAVAAFTALPAHAQTEI